MLRPLAAPLLLLLAACASSLSEEETSQLEDYRMRATRYFDLGRYPQAYQQAVLGLRIDEDHGNLNLLAGRALLMQRELDAVARSLGYLERADEVLDSYKSRYSLAEFHFRYGSMLQEFARKEALRLQSNPLPTNEEQQAALAKNRERQQSARGHLEDAAALLDEVVDEAPEYTNALEMQGQVHTLLGNDERALEALHAAIDVLERSREYKNRVLATRTALSVAQEEKIRRDLYGDIDREIAIRLLLAGIHKRSSDLNAEERQYTRILELDPSRPDAYYNRGLCRYELGRLGPAAADMREFMRRTELPQDSDQVAQAYEIIQEFNRLNPRRPEGAATPTSAPR